MKKPITQNDVAKAAGVTRSIVSYVINGTKGRSVAPATRQRILEAIERLDYRPNKAAQALQQGDIAFASKKIGVIIPSAETFLRPYYAEILAGVHLEAHRQNMHVSFIRFFDEMKNPLLFNSLIHEQEIGGLVLIALDQCLASDTERKLMERIASRLSRVVCVDFCYEGLSCVMFDRREAARQAGCYALGKGYRSIGYVGPNDQRLLGVQEAMAQGGMDSGDELFLAETYDAQGGFCAIQALSAERIPRVLIAGCDEVALGVLSALSRRGLRVPEDVAVVSVDNIESSSFTCPPLTTVDVPKRAMGEQAVRMITGGKAQSDMAPCKVVLPVTLVVRQSC